MLKIAITGNIASGKSLFEKFLKDKGYKVLCLDFVTAFFYENSSCLKEFLLKKFNTLNKKEVAEIVFSNPDIKKELENFIYPLILAEMNNFFIENANETLVFVSAALLFEAGFDKHFDKIVFIKADEDVRLKRLVERDNFSREEAFSRIKSQMKEADKISRSDFIIDNSDTIEALKIVSDEFIKSLNTLL